jgi:hypothetical protein
MKYYIVVSSAGDTKVVVLPANWDNGSLNVCLSRLKTDAQGEFRGGMKIFTEINQDEYRKVTGDSYLSSNYASHPNFFRGDILPEDWREQAMAVLTSGGWIDQLGWEDDLAKLVDEQIDSAPNVRPHAGTHDRTGSRFGTGGIRQVVIWRGSGSPKKRDRTISFKGRTIRLHLLGRLPVQGVGTPYRYRKCRHL